ncbi:TetR/AcrR family transcriptional regulator, partial [Rhizobium ruizarguesonis]
MGAMIVSVDTAEPSEFSPRQNAVLEQALQLLVDGGEK